MNLVNLKNRNPEFIRNISLKYNGTDRELSDGDATTSLEEFQIVIQKQKSPEILYLFHGTSLKNVERELVSADAVLIADMESTSTFSTYRNRYALWTHDAVSDYAPSEPLLDPRSYTRDYTDSRLVPSDVRPWLIRSAPETSSHAYEEWLLLASKKLIATIAEQVSKGPSGISYHFDGPPKVDIMLSGDEILNAYPFLHEGAKWIFVDGKLHADTRHMLLASEWARSYQRDRIELLGKDCLEPAHVRYEAFINSSVRETLKALADLRKTIFDEAQKASQKAQDLGVALWKDLTVAAIPMLVKISLDVSKSSNQFLISSLAASAAIFLICSFGFQVYLNHEFFRAQGNARHVSNKKISTILTKSEIDELSEAPIIRSIKVYKRALIFISIIYSIIIFALACLTYIEIKDGYRPDSNSAPRWLAETSPTPTAPSSEP